MFIVIEDLNGKIIIEPNSFRMFRSIPNLNEIQDSFKRYLKDSRASFFEYFIIDKMISSIEDAKNKIILFDDDKEIPNEIYKIYKAEESLKIYISPSENSTYIDSNKIYIENLKDKTDIDSISNIKDTKSNILIRLFSTDNIEVVKTHDKEEYNI